MQSFAAFFETFGAWTWLIGGVVLLILETVIPGVLLMWLGVAALIVGMLLLVIDVSWQWQFVMFAALSVASVFVMRRWFSRSETADDNTGLNTSGSNFVGRTFVVAEPIQNGRGRVRVGDTHWTAEGADVPAGTRVTVVSVRGTVLNVEPAAR
ncbi:MAG: NfeD family protein [Pseudomonadota bacterium]